MKSIRVFTRICSPAALFLAAATCHAQAVTAYTITTVAGTGSAGYSGDGGPATSAQLAGVYGIFVDSSGNLFIADQFNHRIRKVGADGNINTVAGSGTSGYLGDGQAATNSKVQMTNPEGVAVDSSGNIYIGDTGNHVVRKVSGGNIATFAGTNSPGYGGDGAGATGALLNLPTLVVLDSSNNLYIADSGNNAIRMVTGTTISTVAGTGEANYAGDGGAPKTAKLNNPQGLAIDRAGNVYIADSNNHRIRMISNGIITTVAGNGTNAAFAGDGGPATKAELNHPKGVALDSAGNLYIADAFNNRIRMVNPSGIITTIAGVRAAGYSGDNGPAATAQLNSPVAVAVGPKGVIYIADNQNNVVRMLTPTPITANPPSIGAGGVVSAANFGAFSAAAAGSWIEIYGSNLASNSRTWSGSDFKGNTAPTSLDGTSVTIGGQAAYVAYISPNQVNAQIPSNTGVGPQQLFVSTAAGTSAPAQITINLTQPGLFAPPQLVIGGKPYLGALFSDGATYVLPSGAVPGFMSRAARPGDTIVVYGIGFGPLNPDTPAGQIAQGKTNIASPVQIRFGDVTADLTYSGLTSGLVGLYQFNVVVPNIAPGDAIPVTFSVGGVPGTQTLYTAVQ